MEDNKNKKNNQSSQSASDKVLLAKLKELLEEKLMKV